MVMGPQIQPQSWIVESGDDVYEFDAIPRKPSVRIASNTKVFGVHANKGGQSWNNFMDKEGDIQDRPKAFAEHKRLYKLHNVLCFLRAAAQMDDSKCRHKQEPGDNKSINTLLRCRHLLGRQ